MMVAMAIGVAAVVVLTALGDGARRYVVDQFSSIGSNLVIVLPGRSQTGGFSPANVVTTTPRDLTIEDARALQRASAIRRLAPMAVGLSETSAGGRLRETTVVGTTSEFLDVRRMSLAQGRFLPPDEWSRGSAVVVLGSKLRTELFGNAPALGQWVRVGDRRLRVIGVLAPAGQGLGLATDELAIVPVALAQAMFNTNTLFRILIEARSRDAIPSRQGASDRDPEAAPRRRRRCHRDHARCGAPNVRSVAGRTDRGCRRHCRNQSCGSRHPGNERDAGRRDSTHG